VIYTQYTYPHELPTFLCHYPPRCTPIPAIPASRIQPHPQCTLLSQLYSRQKIVTSSLQSPLMMYYCSLPIPILLLTTLVRLCPISTRDVLLFSSLHQRTTLPYPFYSSLYLYASPQGIPLLATTTSLLPNLFHSCLVYTFPCHYSHAVLPSRLHPPLAFISAQLSAAFLYTLRCIVLTT